MTMKDTSEITRMRARLVEFHVGKTQDSPILLASRLLRDPLKPASKDGRFGTNPIFVALAVICGLILGVFLIFNFGV